MAATVLNGRAIVAAERAAVLEALQSEDREGVVEEIVREAHDRAQWLVEEAKRVAPPGPISCREGCAFCCHLRVRTTIPEVLRIAASLRSRLDDAGIAAVRARAEAHERGSAGLDAEERLRLRTPCPLLEGGRCTVYPVRPSSCRGWNSLDVDGCEADLIDPRRGVRVPTYLAQHQAYALVQEGVAVGLDAAGLESHPVDLAAALRIALDHPDAARRWLSGEALFGDADR